MKVAGVVANIVPYHRARWNAFVGLVKECHLIEVSNRDEFKSLEAADGPEQAFSRKTIFPERMVREIPVEQLRIGVARALDEVGPDVIVLNGYAASYSLAALEWGVAKGVPSVVCSESNEFDEHRRYWKELIKRRVLRLCAAGLAGGTLHAQYLCKLGMAPDAIFLGYDAVDNAYFAAGAARARAAERQTREELGLPGKFFLACGRFTQKKNHALLLRAYANYIQKGTSESSVVSLRTHKPWSLVFVGDGPLGTLLQRLIEELGLQSWVNIAGAREYEQIPAYYGLAGALVHASTTEQWGLVVNEAMASGLPVLVSARCGCAADLVQEGRNGFTFDPFVVDALAALLSRLAGAERADYEAMGKASQEIVAEWGLERFASSLKQAVDLATHREMHRANLADKLLLKVLLSR
jgi:glycosyltransferase involved in cell wall biosynthesis